MCKRDSEWSKVEVWVAEAPLEAEVVCSHILAECLKVCPALKTVDCLVVSDTGCTESWDYVAFTRLTQCVVVGIKLTRSDILDSRDFRTKLFS